MPTNVLALDLGLHLRTSEPDFRVTLADAIQRRQHDPDCRDYFIKFCSEHGHLDLIPNWFYKERTTNAN